MRTKSVTIGNYTFKVTYPDYFIISHSPDSYVRVHTDSYINKEISLTLRNETDYTGITVTRTIDILTGDAVFPIADMLDYLADMGDSAIAKAVDIILSIDGNASTIFNITALIGASDETVSAFDSLPSMALMNNAPFPSRIVVYPNGPEECQTVPIFYPRKNIITPNVAYTYDYRPLHIVSIGAITYNGTGFLQIPLDAIKDYLTSGEFSYFSINERSQEEGFLHSMTVYVNTDTCAEGIFTRWTDRHGFLFFFRWDVEKSTEEVETVDTHIALQSENLDPYDINIKQSQTVYTLHSGMIEDELYELASSILSAQKVECYDEDRGGWIPCTINDSDIEDNLDDLKDVIIELVKVNRTIL